MNLFIMSKIESEMTPESFGLLVSSFILCILFWIAFFMIVHVMVRHDRNSSRLGSAIASFVGAFFWTLNLGARAIYGYIGPSRFFSYLGIFENAVFAFGLILMAIAIHSVYKRQ